MDQRQIIELAEQKVNGAAQLAKILDIAPTVVSDAKRGARGIPRKCWSMLAKTADVPESEVVLADYKRKSQRGFATTAAMVATLAGAVLVTLFFTRGANAAQPCGSTSVSTVEYTLCELPPPARPSFAGY